MVEKIINWKPGGVKHRRDKKETETDRNLRLEILELRGLLGEADRSNRRKVMLLHESDHRIKNSLQIVASLMNLQANRELTETSREALLTASHRIQSIARIHDALQMSDDANSVDLGAVLTKTCDLLQAVAGRPSGITIAADVQAVQIPAAVAQPLALAVNELVVNALRHAFPGGRSGLVRVTLKVRGGRLVVIVADDGVGMPDDDAAGSGYGTKMVRMAVEQVYGSLLVTRRPGTTFTITAPCPCQPRRRSGSCRP